MELEGLERFDRHLLEDGRTLAEDLGNEVVTYATLDWDTLRRSQKIPTCKGSGKIADKMIKTCVKKQYEEVRGEAQAALCRCRG